MGFQINGLNVCKNFYDKFFDNKPEYINYKLRKKIIKKPWAVKKL